MRRTTVRLELTEAQKEQMRAAIGREVNVLELRLQGGPEPAGGLEGAAAPEIPIGPGKEPVRQEEQV
jgi:hypothetical protein